MTPFSPTIAAVHAPRARVIADPLGGTIMREVTLVTSAVAVITLLSQILIPLGFTPVPLSLGTLAVLIVGASLGPARAVVATTVYLLVGITGLPVFAGGASGWQFASFGYILGYIGAAAIVGELARRRADRHIMRTLALGTVGTVIIYAAGVSWLMVATGADLSTAWRWGVAPFLMGDALKIAALAFSLPAIWRFKDSMENKRS